jgi:hypothetical protein
MHLALDSQGYRRRSIISQVTKGRETATLGVGQEASGAVDSTRMRSGRLHGSFQPLANTETRLGQLGAACTRQAPTGTFRHGVWDAWVGVVGPGMLVPQA